MGADLRSQSIPRVLFPAKVTPTSAPLAVARPTRANSEQFNSIRVVRNVRDFVSVYGRKDFQSGEQEAPVSPKGQVVPTVREEKIFSPVSVPPRPNVVHAHQEMHKKQQVIKTDGHQYTKPAKREMHSVAAHAHPAPVEVPYYQPPHCCCCNHLMHLHHSQQHAYNLVHNPALMHNVAPMLQYHHAGEHHHEGFQYGGHHHELEHQHHFEDHRGRADSDESFVLVTVSERRAAFEQKTSDANGSFHEGPKPMVDIYSD
ncbi:unnamed protein product [Heligmosomoides polygyrus]|uniref:ZM domain-containing protein n=1 Tax=Heligmosomoides polygyrus TaxID=6339 RepID=A0A183FU51_HELPZ|nr:unnamed protein product [Heligmosomoides polygyrus]